MHVLVVSDTHMPRHGRGIPRVLVEAVRELDIRLILHLGDFTEPEVAGWFEALAPFDAVAGNNDGPEVASRFGRRKVVEADGVRLGMIHGDGTRGTTRGRAVDAFATERVDAVLFGHSHIPLLERIGDRLLLNPGSPTDKRRQRRFSFGVLAIEHGRLRAELRSFDDKAP